MDANSASDPASRALLRAVGARRGERAPDPVRATRLLAIGDPQASAEHFFAILAHHGLLSESGWLEPTVHLVSIGDHFDYGPFEHRAEAARAGTAVLAWLAAHAPEQVTLIAGNHDLARVAELHAIDDATFQRAAERAFELYATPPVKYADERAFLRDYPMFPSVEVAARDLSSFRVEQRELVERLLRAGRFCLGASIQSVLFVHAGATRADLRAVGLQESEWSQAERVALHLNEVFDAAVENWQLGTPFEVPPLFVPGSAERGEPDGFLFHRPAQFESLGAERARRFDPRTLPRGLCQVVGHVRDPRCRQLLGSWVRDAREPEGRLRHLSVRDGSVSYGYGLVPPRSADATMIFIDGGMQHVPVEQYELLDVGAWLP